MIPVIYYEDITAILMNYKIPGYYIFFICLAVDFLFFQSWNDCICFSVYMGRLKP